MDVNTLKGRIGEAFVESILRQARYKVARLGRESQLQRMLKRGESDFLPDFLVWKAVGTSPDGVPLHRLFCVEVKYRANVRDYLCRFGADLVSQVGEHWPEVYVIFVTDHPDDRRSCFQLLHLTNSGTDSPLATIDLHEASALGIDKTFIDKHERLVREVFSPLGAMWPERDLLRKPPAKVPVDNGVSVEVHPSRELPA